MAIKAKVIIPKDGPVGIRLVDCSGPGCVPKMDTLLEVLKVKDQITERVALPEMAQPDENTVLNDINVDAGSEHIPGSGI